MSKPRFTSQDAAGPHVIDASHPASLTPPSEINTKVKQPEVSVEIKGFAGVVVPLSPAKRVPAVPFPLKMNKLS